LTRTLFLIAIHIQGIPMKLSTLYVIFFVLVAVVVPLSYYKYTITDTKEYRKTVTQEKTVQLDKKEVNMPMPPEEKKPVFKALPH
jgi:hypothetical protein